MSMVSEALWPGLNSNASGGVLADAARVMGRRGEFAGSPEARPTQVRASGASGLWERGWVRMKVAVQRWFDRGFVESPWRAFPRAINVPADLIFRGVRNSTGHLEQRP